MVRYFLALHDGTTPKPIGLMASHRFVADVTPDLAPWSNAVDININGYALDVNALYDFVRNCGKYAHLVSSDPECSNPFAVNLLINGDHYANFRWETVDYAASVQAFSLTGRASVSPPLTIPREYNCI